MFFRDLSHHTYSRNNILGFKTLNIGWLTKRKSFQTGNIPDGFLDKLWLYCKFHIHSSRGYHACEFCNSLLAMGNKVVGSDNTRILLGTAQIRVFGKDNNVYAAPNLIYHYIQEHKYLPPQEFIDAVEYGKGIYSDKELHLLERTGQLSPYWRESLPYFVEPVNNNN